MSSTATPEGGAPEPPPPSGGRPARFLHAFRRHILRNSLIAAAAVTAVTTAVAVLVTSLTERVVADDPPPTCPGTACDGRSPESTGCGEDAGSHRPAEGNPATLEIRYNPDCQAVWGRILTGEPGDRVTVRVTGGGSTEAQIAYETDQFTRMVAVDPDTFRVEVCAVPGVSPERRADWPGYCVEAGEDTEFSLR
ncbi:DUF2690 domain-containing protein [Streptomyces hainanensis]|uniref:DUF2690 domain-containing protein n=1 Tax=Streptomyces hainanensis TaxID=402648 RepID=A0A4R4SNN6_9ACTN|nr:DUF2690 domain-containing protein [Streptomyces hainanensis]TDC64204.1 DUF2690 domain-containing protein [Streptomyces hainanensis]